MQILKALTLLLFTLVTITGCQKEDVYYGVNDVQVTPPNGDKQKLKSETQYIQILYANLFQKALSANQIVEIGRVIQSLGDKVLAYELIYAKFAEKPDVIMPSNAEMWADVEQFTIDTYERFFIRDPSELEKTWMVNYINNNTDITVELVYFAFSISDEYNFY